MGERAGRMLVGPGRPFDLIIVCLLAVVAVLLSFYARDSALTSALAFLAVFFCPGYAVVSALFPGNREILAQSFVTRREERTFYISMIERIALAFGMSAVVMALAGTFLTRALYSLNVVTVGLAVVFITVILSAYAVARRSKLAPGDQFAVFTRAKAPPGAPRRRGFSRGEKAVAALSALGLVMFAVVALNGLNAGPSDDDIQFTEFYITGSDGNLQQLPQELSPGQGGTVRVTVNSHLSSTQECRLTVALYAVNGGSAFMYPGITGPISEPRSMLLTVGPDNQWSQLVTFSIPSAGSFNVFFTLDDGHEVKSLWIPITVTGASTGGGEAD